MKGISYTSSRGRDFSPSPGDRYLKLGSKGQEYTHFLCEIPKRIYEKKNKKKKKKKQIRNKTKRKIWRLNAQQMCIVKKQFQDSTIV